MILALATFTTWFKVTFSKKVIKLKHREFDKRTNNFPPISLFFQIWHIRKYKLESCRFIGLCKQSRQGNSQWGSLYMFMSDSQNFNRAFSKLGQDSFNTFPLLPGHFKHNMPWITMNRCLFFFLPRRHSDVHSLIKINFTLWVLK